MFLYSSVYAQSRCTLFAYHHQQNTSNLHVLSKTKAIWTEHFALHEISQDIIQCHQQKGQTIL